MLERIIEWTIHNRLLSTILLALTLAAGVFAVRSISLDAIPDLSDVQVVVFTEYPGQSPQVVEDQVTYPLTTTMLSVPGAEVVRGYSFFGLSFVYIIFEDGTDMYWARSRVLEYLNYVGDQLPDGVSPALGPDATGVGWVYEYALTSDTLDLQQLRSIQDWQLRYELQQVEGVSEVASLGGFVKQYQVTVYPQKLQAHDLSLAKVSRAIQRSNRDVGGRVVELAETEFMVRSHGYLTSVEDLLGIPVGVDEDHIPIRLEDVADVVIGPELRRGFADLNGQGEVVGGIVIARFGANSYQVIEDVKERLDELKATLPEGVEIVSVYDRSSLIEQAVETLQGKIVEETLIVGLICILFLFHVRSAIVVISTLPGGILLAFLAMWAQGLTADIMSLGGIAIAIGAMIDAAIVLIENMHRHMERAEPDKDSWSIAMEASKEVGPSLFFSLLIIAVSFMPIFALTGQEGRLFKPLAFTKTYAMLGAAALSITMVPLLMGLLIRGKIRPAAEHPVNRALTAAYRPALAAVLRNPWKVLLIAALVLVATWWPLTRLGSEFMPPLDEGDLLYMPSLLPGVSMTTAKQVVQATDRQILKTPEVSRVFGKAGRAQSATDPAPVNMIETVIQLKPREEWRPGMTTEKIMAELDANVRMPGITNAWTMPIKTRIDMLSTGIKTPVGIKLVGPDLDVLAELAEQIEGPLRNVPGTASVYAERVTGGNFLDITIDRDAASRYGIQVDDVQHVISSAVGGMNVTQTVEGLERYPVNVRYPREFRESIESMDGILVWSPMGHHVPLGQVADLAFMKGPPVIKTEGARPTAWIYVDVTTSDIGGYVAAAREVVDASIELPPGYDIVWSGQFEYMERAAQRLRMIVPVTVLLVFLLLFIHFRSIRDAGLVMAGLPFAVVGGIWLLWALSFDMSVAVSVGFIALAGVASEMIVVMVVYLEHAMAALGPQERSLDRLNEVITHGASQRVRPIIMTACAAIGGLLPIMWSHGTGASITQRIAAPMIGGLVSTTVVSLLVVPVAYALVVRLQWRAARSSSVDGAEIDHPGRR
ncbi:MAG TPA: efflux RND transporter permease subunit [Deltaproteobacteria bacterium]|nr:efflux RND transporter permease subunit [Deltaproteobacteria bacterium]